MTRYKYLCIERPPAPGAVPKNGLLGVNYGEGEIYGKHTWGWVEYNRRLTLEEVEGYELIPIVDVEVELEDG